LATAQSFVAAMLFIGILFGAFLTGQYVGYLKNERAKRDQ
jgi:hypothetical protein